MTCLIRHPNLERVDDIYQQLLHMHEGLDEAQSLQASARLILLLANHIGDSSVVLSAIALATSAAGKAAD
ncbi:MULTISPECIES: DUF2783 domain-containing protein [Comamonas]|mgnify:CR=1 FL=1|uniref:DUF2783 domain-containing protein n=1 Tax=Comamonas TaxID=283 RepID=UPI0014028E91|nr:MULTISPECIES: DUF2783 domain-containing protein [Comamonas]